MIAASAARNCTLERSCRIDSTASEHPNSHEIFKVSFVADLDRSARAAQCYCGARGRHEASIGRGSLLRSVMDEFLRWDPESFLKEGLEDEMCLSSEVEASRPQGPLLYTHNTSATHLPICRYDARLAQPQEVSSSVKQATARPRYVLHCYLPIICHCGSTLRSFLLTCYLWTVVYEDLDDFHLHDDRQATPSREPISPEPDAGRVRSGCKEPCTPQSGALPPGVDFEFVRRSSHSRKRDPDHIPRPPNAFMLFRSDFWEKEKNKLTVERDHRMISRIAGLEWNKLSEAQRAPYRSKAERAKQQHAQLYPNYKYTPVFRKEKPTSRRKGAKGHTGVARALPEDLEGDTLAEWPKSEENEDDLLVRAPRLRGQASRARAKKSRPRARLPTPETRSPSPVSSVSEDDHIKSEPSTPELTFSPEPAKTEIDSSPYLPSRVLVRRSSLTKFTNPHFP